MQEKEVFRKKLAAYARIAVFAALAILFAVLSVLELLPKNQSGLQMKEAIGISSAPLTPLGSQEKRYTCLLMGTLENPTDDEIRVEALRVTVEGEGKEKLLELSGFVLPARNSHEVSLSFEDTVNYDSVKSVSVKTLNTEERIPNREAGAWRISGALIFCLVGFAVTALLLVDSCKRFGYLRQELAARSQIL